MTFYERMKTNEFCPRCLAHGKKVELVYREVGMGIIFSHMTKKLCPECGWPEKHRLLWAIHS